MNIQTEFYEFKGQYGCTRCKQKIIENSSVIAHECNSKHCKYILCPKCNKELITSIVTSKNNEMTNTLPSEKTKRTSRRSRANVDYNE